MSPQALEQRSESIEMVGLVVQAFGLRRKVLAARIHLDLQNTPLAHEGVHYYVLQAQPPASKSARSLPTTDDNFLDCLPAPFTALSRAARKRCQKKRQPGPDQSLRAWCLAVSRAIYLCHARVRCTCAFSFEHPLSVSF